MKYQIGVCDTQPGPNHDPNVITTYTLVRVAYCIGWCCNIEVRTASGPPGVPPAIVNLAGGRYTGYQNYCVNAGGQEVSVNSTSAEDRPEVCQFRCEHAPGCTGFSWYVSSWQGNSCYLTNDAVTRGSNETQRRDALCYVRDSAVTTPDWPSGVPDPWDNNATLSNVNGPTW